MMKVMSMTRQDTESPNKHGYRDNSAFALATPRCQVTYTDGRRCKLAALRINPGSKSPTEKMYTKHCKIHGGRQELDAIHRRAAQADALKSIGRIGNEVMNSLGIDSTTGPTENGQSPTSNEHCPTSLHGHDDARACHAPTMDALSSTSLHPDPNPKGGSGSSLKDTTSVGLPSSSCPSVCGEGGRVEKSEPKNFGVSDFGDQAPSDGQYTLPDRTLSKGFARKLAHRDALSLNEELALVKTLIQEELKSMRSGRVDPASWKKLDGMMKRVESLMNVILKLEEARRTMYTRESMKMDLMKVLNCIKKWLPEEDKRRGLANDLVRLIGPTMADPGDTIIVRS